MSGNRKYPLPNIGEKFDRLTILEVFHLRDSRNMKVLYVKCQCDCGNVKEKMRFDHICKGESRSCGCYFLEMASEIAKKSSLDKRNPYRNTRLYIVWAGMKNRCKSPNGFAAQYYHDKGISVCEEWKDFIGFRSWALDSGYQENLSIDRIDVNGNYCPENCRWVEWDIQANNKTNTIYLTAFGETKPIHFWPDDPRCVVNEGCLRTRIQRGWDHEEAITTRPETWTVEEDQFLLENYKKLSGGEIAKELNRSRPSVYYRAGELGLRKVNLNHHKKKQKSV